MDTLLLEPRPLPLRVLLAELWRSRSLALALGRQGFFVGYRRASLGVLWAVALPVVQAAAMALVFSRVVRIDTGVNYIAFVLSGMIAWSFFSGTISVASTAIVDGAGMASKIYFPRAVLPLVRVISGLYGLAISLVVLLVLTTALGVRPGLHTLYLVPAVGLLVALTVGFCLTSSALHVYFRDVRFLVQGSLTIWFYGTPVFYPLRFTHGILHTIVLANPMTGVVELFRLGIAGADGDAGLAVLVSASWALVLLVAAAILHRRFDRNFSDLL